jgi:hypothetical protein
MRFHRTSRVLVVVAILAAAAASSAPALADGPLNLTLRLGSHCLSGHKPSDQRVTVKLLRSDGTVLETRHDDTIEFHWAACFTDHVPVAGNRIRLVNGATDRTVRVPDLTLTVDRAASVIDGHAPAGKTLEIGYSWCDAAGGCSIETGYMTTANSHGRYRKDLSASEDIDGSDRVRADYVTAQGDRFSRRTTAPYMTITSPDRFSLSCMPRGTTTIRLSSATGVLRASKSFTTHRDCATVSGRFRKGGDAVNIHVGDRITSDFAVDAKLTWPRVSVAGSGYDYSGRCFPNVQAEFLVDHDGVIARHSIDTDSDGRFSATGYQLFVAGDKLRLVCESARGDRVSKSVTVAS